MAFRSSGPGSSRRAIGALLLALSPAAAFPATPAPSDGDYIVLANEAVHARLEQALQAAPGVRRASVPGGSDYAACLSAWPGDPDESSACIQSRIGRQSVPGRVVLHAYPTPAPGEGLVVDCLAAAGRDRATLARVARNDDAPTLAGCLAQARRGNEPVPHDTYAIRSPDYLTPHGRGQAAAVLTVAVDHVGIPRGVLGTCRVEGRVTSVVRGAGLSPRGRVELAIPCRATPADDDARRIDMSQLAAGTFARLYLDTGQTLLDYERMTR